MKLSGKISDRIRSGEVKAETNPARENHVGLHVVRKLTDERDTEGKSLGKRR